MCYRAWPQESFCKSVSSLNGRSTLVRNTNVTYSRIGITRKNLSFPFYSLANQTGSSRRQAGFLPPRWWLEALPLKITKSFALQNTIFTCLNLPIFLSLGLTFSFKNIYFKLNYLLGWGQGKGIRNFKQHSQVSYEKKGWGNDSRQNNSVYFGKASLFGNHNATILDSRLPFLQSFGLLAIASSVETHPNLTEVINPQKTAACFC